MIRPTRHRKARIAEFHVIDNSQAAVIVEYNFKHLVISLFRATQIEGPVENHLIDLLRQAAVAEKEWKDDTFDEYDDWDDGLEKHGKLRRKAEKQICSIGKFAFAQSAPPVITTPNGLSLQDLLFPVVVHFRLQTVGGKAKMMRIRSDQAASMPDRDATLKDDPLFKPDPAIPALSAAEIQVLVPIDNAVGWKPVCKVCAWGEIMMAKASRKVLLPIPDLATEMKKMSQIDKAKDRFSLDIPTRELIAYVTDAHTGTILGFLGEWIQACPAGRTLDAIDLRKVPRDLKEKWAEQIEKAVEDLHALDLLWVTASPPMSSSTRNRKRTSLTWAAPLRNAGWIQRTPTLWRGINKAWVE